MLKKKKYSSFIKKEIIEQKITDAGRKEEQHDNSKRVK